MCGISGITNFEIKPSKKIVEAMRNKIAHRAPILKLVGKINKLHRICKIGNN